MKGTQTYAMVKPHAVAAGNTGEIIAAIQRAGFRVKALRMTKLSLEDASKFYEVHNERPFYQELCELMSEGPVVAMILEKGGAVTDFRNFIGETNPSEAAPGTIRALFGESIDKNAIHGSDSDENAELEGNFFFPLLERF